MTVRAAERMMVTRNQEVTPMARKAQLSLDHATDLWIGELARQGKSPNTRRKYRETLDPFCETYEHLAPGEITADHCRRFLDRWSNHAPSTLALHVTVIRRFFAFLDDEGIVARSPAERLRRPRRPRAEDIDVVSVSAGDVSRMFDACETWQELLCLAVIVYMGIRRGAAARVRLGDVDFDNGTIRFREKGAKAIVKPMPDELAAILKAARTQGVWESADDYLIPNRRRSTVRTRGERGHKVIYETIVKVARRAGVRSHVHALRAAFAVQFDEAHPDQLVALKELLGHARIETTMVYLRRKDKARSMETVRDLSWGSSVFPAKAVVPPTGFEPVLGEDASVERPGAATEPGGVPEALRAKLLELSLAAKLKGRVQA